MFPFEKKPAFTKISPKLGQNLSERVLEDLSYRGNKYLVGPVLLENKGGDEI